MDGTKIAAAWQEWLDSEEGQKASAGGLADTNDLEKAFLAGMKFGATAVADEVTAAIEKEKQQ
jgi:hypothetical protein